MNFDPKHPAERVEINNCGNLQLLYPDSTFFSEMKVFVDGVEQDWFVKRSTIMCEDKNGDFVCDICTYKISCSKNHPTSGDTIVKCDDCGSVRYKNSGESLPELKVEFEYMFKGYLTQAYTGSSLSAVIASADAGSTVKLMSDSTEVLSATYTIAKDLTIDLNGKTLTVYTPADSAAYHVANGKVLTWQGSGTVRCMIEGSEYTKGRPLTSLGVGSTVNYNNVTAFVSCLAFSYNSSDVKININGGEYYALGTSQAGQAAFFETRANVTLTAKDALFCMSYFKSSYSANSYNLISASNNYTSGNNCYNDYTFTNCDIVRHDKGNILNYANSVTVIRFNDCRIYAKLNNGTFYSSDSNKGLSATKSGLYVLGSGTRVLGNTSTYLGSYTVYADGCSISKSSKSVSYSFKKQTGTGTGISVGTQSKSYSYSYVVS